jgi:hypothetical protein
MNGGTHHTLIVLCSQEKFVENCRVLPIVFIVIAVATPQKSSARTTFLDIPKV